MNRPALHIASPSDAPAPDPLAEARAAVERIKAERVELFVERLSEVIDLAQEISAPDAGYAPGICEGARRVLLRLTDERQTLQAVRGRR